MKRVLLILVFGLIAMLMNAENIPFNGNPYSSFEANGHTWQVSNRSTQANGSYVYFMSNYGANEDVTMDEGSNTFQMNSIDLYGPGYAYTVTVKGYLNTTEHYSQDFNVTSSSWSTFGVTGSWTGINKIRIINTGNTISVGFDNLNYTPENADPTNISLSNTSVDDGDPSGTTVGTFSTTDLFMGGLHSYTFASGGADNSSFTIDGSTLKTAFTADYDTKSSYSIKIRSTDEGSLWYEKDFTITIRPDTPSEYIVSDAEDPDYNGTYILEGSYYGDYPIYTKDATYFLFNMGCTSYWCLADDDPDNYPCPAYSNTTSSVLPNTDGWRIGGDDGTYTGDSSGLQITGEAPLPVTLSSFTASFTEGSSTLSWTTQSESSNLGWNVYRSETEEFADGFVLNEDLIDGAGTTTEPTDYSYCDPYPSLEGSGYWFWLESISFSGDSEIFGPVTLSVPQSDPGQNTPIVPETFGLYQNYPNPFNPSTEISFALETAASCELVIYDVKGRMIKTVFSGSIEANRVYSFIWNGEDQSGKNVSSGIYYYKMKAGKIQQTKKMILLK